MVLDQAPLRLVHAGLVQALFPKARLLVSLRHPCDAVLDNFMHAGPGDAEANFHTLAGAVRLYDATLRPVAQAAAAPVAADGRAAPRRSRHGAQDRAGRGLRLPRHRLGPRAAGGHGRRRAAAATLRGPAFAARRTVPHWERYRTPLQPFLRTLGEQARRLGYDMAPSARD